VLIGLTLPMIPFHLSGPLEGLLLLIALPLVWAGVDLLSGIVHWALDTYGSPETPLIGPVIGDFREHHVLPDAILEKDFLACSANAALLGVPVMIGAHITASALPVGGGLLLGGAVAFTSASVLTNYIHRIAHDPDSTPTQRKLQRWGLILKTEEHDRHHSGNYRCAYAITTGWTNGLAERFGLYERAEALIARSRDASQEATRSN